MVEKFTGFRATSGRTFDNERDAWVDELETKLAPIVENEAITRKLATVIGDNPHDIADVLAHIVMMSPLATDYSTRVLDQIRNGTAEENTKLDSELV